MDIVSMIKILHGSHLLLADYVTGLGLNIQNLFWSGNLMNFIYFMHPAVYSLSGHMVSRSSRYIDNDDL
jgi:hypothetical protein